MNSEHVARMEFVYGSSDEELVALLDESLDPRSPDVLLDMAESLLTAESRLLDIGCRDARHLIPLVERTGCSGIGIDPVAMNLERACAAVTAAGLDDRIEIRNGVMEQIGEPDDSIDLVWCRDVLEAVPDLEGGMKEVARVLRPGGAALIYTAVTTPRMEPGEVATFDAVGNVSRNLDRSILEAAIENAGLRIESADEIRTEFREYEEERSNRVSESLLRLARLRRREAEIVERFGREKYDLWDASLQWLAFLFLGKVEPVAYLLRLGVG
jgi:ubiquinone/menaquinone biosynthesis C-methylase UbiE